MKGKSINSQLIAISFGCMGYTSHKSNFVACPACYINSKNECFKCQLLNRQLMYCPFGVKGKAHKSGVSHAKMPKHKNDGKSWAKNH